MNLEKFTDRAKGFLQSAQTVAVRMNHQRITPEHILKALLEDKEGMASGLIQRSGGNPADRAGGGRQGAGQDPGVFRAAARRPRRGWKTMRCGVLDQAEQLATKAGDSFVSVQRMLQALALGTTNAGRAGAEGGGSRSQSARSGDPGSHRRAHGGQLRSGKRL